MISKFLIIGSGKIEMSPIQCFLIITFLCAFLTSTAPQQTPAGGSPFAAAPGSVALSQLTPSPTAPAGANPFAAAPGAASPFAAAPAAPAAPFAAAPGAASPFAAPPASPAAPFAPAPGAASPFAVTQQTPAGGSPFAAAPAAPLASAPGADSPFAAAPGIAAPVLSPISPPQQTPVAPVVTNYYEDLDAGKKAITNQKKPGFVFLTNPEEEDNQRVAQIMTLPMFKEVLTRYIFIKIDVGKNPKVLSRYGIYKTPSIILYDSEGRMRKKVQSISDMNYLMQELKKIE